jgi:phosphate-selective porin OprO/OprP
MKMKLLTTTASVLALAIAAQANAGVVTSKGDDLVISTKSGLKVATADGNTSFAVGGRIQWDYADIDVNGNNVVKDTYIRRARVFFKGHNGDWAYKAQYNLDDDRGVAKRKGGTVEDLYIRYTGFDIGNITVGKQKAPFGLEQLTSSKDITALERSASTSLFTAGRQTGIQFNGNSGMFTYALGVFEANEEVLESGEFLDLPDDDAESFAYVGRATFAPINDEGNVLHFGAGFIAADDNSQNFQLKDVYNFEAAGVVGPFHIQAEFFDGELAGQDVDTYYVQAGWVITGESRPYKKGAFKRIKPNSDSGAWELVARYNDGSGDFEQFDEVEAKSYLFGVNWYATNNVRIGANYTTIEEDATNNDADIFQMRIQYVYE